MTAAVRAGRAAAVRPVPARAHRDAADDPGPRADDAAASAAAVRLRDRRGQRGGLPRSPGRRRLHRDLHPEDRRVGHRRRRERLPHRLLRAARLPGAVAAVLQAGDGRRVRARLRGRPGLPGRAPRHRPPPGTVHEPGRRAWLHHRPLRRDAGLPGRRRRHGRFSTGTGWLSHALARRDAADGASRDPAYPLRGARWQCCPRATGEDVTGEDDLAPAHERWLVRVGRARARQRAAVRDRLPADEQAVLHPPGPGAAAATPTASTCCSAAPRS